MIALEELLKQDRFISQGDFVHLNEKNFKERQELVKKHNENYINRHLVTDRDYLDTILTSVDPNISLDIEQRKVILNEEDHCLVIAGAGAGKTTTLAAKVKYLVDKRGIKPEEILVISFTNKAVGELKEKIQNQLKIPAIITTFHAIGYSVVKRTRELSNIFRSDNLFFVLLEYFKNDILTDEETMHKLLLFFEEYFSVIHKNEYETLKSNPKTIEEIIANKSKKKITINEERVKSFEEAQIANFLYCNGIRYIYESEYPYALPNSKKIYTPDFLLIQGKNSAYLEHFGLDENGSNTHYTKEELDRYRKAIQDKIKLHAMHQTKLLYTFSSYQDKKSRLVHLKELLERNGFSLYPIKEEELLKKLTSNENNRYIKKIVMLLSNFIRNFKVNGFSYDDFEALKNKTSNVRTKLFLDIARECYTYYQNFLAKRQMVDFEDMINTSKSILNRMKQENKKLPYKYIIIDEYQDISKQRFNLAKALLEVSDAKLMAVGDDWQTIYSFSGSDITLFTQFLSIMGYGDELVIRNTYRNAQEVIDIAGGFIQRNDKQIKKRLVSPKHIADPVIIIPYDNTPKDVKSKEQNGALFEFSKVLLQTIELIDRYNKIEKKNNLDILLLGRFNFDSNRIISNEYFIFHHKTGRVVCKKYPKYKITFMTAHSAKGLGYSNVILLNGKNDTYGFPAQIDDDPVMNLVIKRDRSYEYAEERRLFYVALTRTKNRVFLICPKNNPSEFIVELKKNYPNVIALGKLNENIYKEKKLVCPWCGYPLYYKMYKKLNRKMYICTNDENLCGFITNNLHGGKMAVEKCSKCLSGYMLVRENRKEGTYFLGCSNYKKNGGCKNTISQKEYYRSHLIR